MKRKLILILIAVLTIGVGVAAADDDVQAMRYGDVHNGRIADPDQGNLYSFEGDAGDEIIIQATSSKIDVYLRLGDSEGDILTENDNFERGSTDAEITYTLPDSDTYYFAVIGYDAGSYSVSLDQAEQNEENSEVVYLNYGDSVQGDAIDDDTPVIFAFEGQEDDVVTITAESEETDTYLVVVDADGEQVAANDDLNKRTTDSQIELQLPADGTYLIGVFGDVAGEFTLTLESDEEGGNTPVSNNQSAGDVYTGTVDDDTPYNTITLEAVEAGTVITVDVQAVSGDLDAYIGISLDGEILVENDDRVEGDPNPMLQFRAEEDGDYVIIITRYDFDKGDTAGDFEATVTLGRGSKAAVQQGAGMVSIADVITGSRAVATDKPETDWSTIGFAEGDRVSTFAQR